MQLTKHTQLDTGNTAKLGDGLKSITDEIFTKHKLAGEENEEHDWGKDFMPKANEFLSENPKSMWAMLKMLKVNEDFSMRLFMKFVHYPLVGSDNRTNFFSSVALQAMEKAVGGNGTEPLSDEQVLLLCDGVNLSELLRDEQAVEENRETIDMVLKFIQDRALTSMPPKISFEDIMPKCIRDETYQRLVAFVEQEAEQGRYSENLKNFIRNGRPAQGTPPNSRYYSPWQVIFIQPSPLTLQCRWTASVPILGSPLS